MGDVTLADLCSVSEPIFLRGVDIKLLLQTY
jgi:hypothetical protein